MAKPAQAQAPKKAATKIKRAKKAKPAQPSASAANGTLAATNQVVSNTAAPAPAPAATKTKPGSANKIDKASVIASKCAEIERLSPRKTAVACLDKFLDREDIAVGDVSTRIYNCRELRKVENNGKDALVEAIISGRMWNLAFLHRREVAKLIEDERQAQGRDHVGPRKVKEIELRAAYEHETAMRNLADSVCDRQAFAELLATDSGVPQLQ